MTSQPPSRGKAEALPGWRTIDQALAVHARGTPRADCLAWQGSTWTYAEVERRVDSLAQALGRAGLVPGDRVALLCTPRPEYVLLLLAASRVGVVYVGINPRCTPAEAAHVLAIAGPRLVLSLDWFEGRDYAPMWRDVMGPLRSPPALRTFQGVDALQRAVEDLVGLPASPCLLDVPQRAALQRVAALVFTSGTTGRPKPAMLTHRGLLLAAAVQHQRLNPPQPRYLCNLPVNHVGCLMNLTLGGLVGGGCIVFQERFAAGETLRLLHDEAIDVWLQVPTMFHECVNHADFDPGRLSRLHSICIGGGAPSAATLARLRSIGAGLFVEYGQTETSSSATYSDAGADDEVLTQCVGRFDPHFEFRIADEQGQVCAVDVTGEIQARGPLIFAGYLSDPASTAAAFTADGWLRTGDLGQLRADGNVVLRGRLKEMIKSGGYNVYPREVELVIEGHAGVAQVVVVALPDARYGEAVHAVLRLRAPPTPADTLAALQALCREHLANYKVPKSFRLVAQFPLLGNGKIDRVQTRVLAAELPALQ